MHQHPYYPQELQLPGYHPMVLPFHFILGVFFAVAAVAMLLTWLVSGQSKQLSTVERMMCCWFVFSGLTHLIVEGAFVLNPEFYKDTSGNFLLDLWKEYSKADSRYATRDSFVVSMEACTAFIEGPGCFLIAIGMLWKCSWRYTLMMLVSLGQLYGDILYFATCYLEGLVHTRPEPLYFWFYFVVMNGIWIVVPAACIMHAAAAVNTAVAHADKLSRKKLP